MKKKKRELTKLGKPKTRGYLARRANKAVFLYRRRHLETWLITCDFSGGKKAKANASSTKNRPKFKVGSRFYGRFFPNRCSLSPNGEHFAYFVMRGGRQASYDMQYYCWTAMCTPPSITAEFLLSHDDTWGGGGVFLDDHNLVVFQGMHHKKAEIAAIDGQVFSGVKVYLSDTYDEIPDAAQSIKPVDDRWRGTDHWSMLSGRWQKKCQKTRLLVRYRDDWQAHGDFDCYSYLVVDWKRKPLLPRETMDSVNWADFDLQNRLWLTRGQNVEIYDRPGPGMSDNPDRIIDLEKIVQNAVG